MTASRSRYAFCVPAPRRLERCISEPLKVHLLGNAHYWRLRQSGGHHEGFFQPLCQSVLCSDANDDFSEMRSGSHVLIGGSDLVKTEDFINHRFDLVSGDRLVHRFEHGRGANRNALHVGSSSDDQPGIEFGCRAAQIPDETDASAHPDRGKRLRDRAGPADLDDAIYTLAVGEVLDRLSQSGVVL